jgi:hypothetical protein
MARHPTSQAPEWWGDRLASQIPEREFVNHYLADIPDPDKRLAYLNALDKRMRADGAEEWVRAIAAWRLAQQLKEQHG